MSELKRSRNRKRTQKEKGQKGRKDPRDQNGKSGDETRGGMGPIGRINSGLILLGDGSSSFGDSFGERFWLKNGCMDSEAQNPTLDFFEAAQMQTELAPAVGEVGDLLGGVPAAVADFVGGPGVELNEDVVVFAAFEDVEAAAEEFGGIEVFGFGEFFGGELGSGEAVKRKGAEVAFGGVPGEEVPEVVDAGEVVGVDRAGPSRSCRRRRSGRWGGITGDRGRGGGRGRFWDGRRKSAVAASLCRRTP